MVPYIRRGHIFVFLWSLVLPNCCFSNDITLIKKSAEGFSYKASQSSGSGALHCFKLKHDSLGKELVSEKYSNLAIRVPEFEENDFIIIPDPFPQQLKALKSTLPYVTTYLIFRPKEDVGDEYSGHVAYIRTFQKDKTVEWGYIENVIKNGSFTSAFLLDPNESQTQSMMNTSQRNYEDSKVPSNVFGQNAFPQNVETSVVKSKPLSSDLVPNVIQQNVRMTGGTSAELVPNEFVQNRFQQNLGTGTPFPNGLGPVGFQPSVTTSKPFTNAVGQNRFQQNLGTNKPMSDGLVQNAVQQNMGTTTQFSNALRPTGFQQSWATSKPITNTVGQNAFQQNVGTKKIISNNLVPNAFQQNEGTRKQFSNALVPNGFQQTPASSVGSSKYLSNVLRPTGFQQNMGTNKLESNGVGPIDIQQNVWPSRQSLSNGIFHQPVGVVRSKSLSNVPNGFQQNLGASKPFSNFIGSSGFQPNVRPINSNVLGPNMGSREPFSNILKPNGFQNNVGTSKPFSNFVGTSGLNIRPSKSFSNGGFQPTMGANKSFSNGFEPNPMHRLGGGSGFPYGFGQNLQRFGKSFSRAFEKDATQDIVDVGKSNGSHKDPEENVTQSSMEDVKEFPKALEQNETQPILNSSNALLKVPDQNGTQGIVEDNKEFLKVFGHLRIYPNVSIAGRSMLRSFRSRQKHSPVHLSKHSNYGKSYPSYRHRRSESGEHNKTKKKKKKSEKQVVFRGLGTCDNRDVEINATTFWNVDTRIYYYMNILGVHCDPKFVNDMRTMIEEGLVSEGADFRYVMNLTHPYFTADILDPQEWSSLISAIFLHLFSNVYSDQMENIELQVFDNQSPTNQKISYTARLLTVFVFELLYLLGNHFFYHTIKITNTVIEVLAVMIKSIDSKVTPELMKNDQIQLAGLIGFLQNDVLDTLTVGEYEIPELFNEHFLKNLNSIEAALNNLLSQ